MKYQNNRNKLLYAQQMYHTMKNIFSHTNFYIQLADPDKDYYYESQFKNQAIKVNWKFNETGCNIVSCNPVYPPLQTCNMNDPIVYLTGDHTWITACQPACFNLQIDNDKTSNTKSKWDPQSPYTLWNGKRCYVESHSWLQFLTDPIRRVTDTNDEPDTTGFDVKIRADEFNDSIVTGSINEKYCRDNFLDFDTSNGKCDMTGFLHYLSFFTGTSLIKLTQMSVSKIEQVMLDKMNKYTRIDGQAQFDFWKSFDEWKRKIDTTKIPIPIDITLTDLGINANNEHLIWTNEFSNLSDGRNDKFGGRLVEPLLVYKNVPNTQSLLHNFRSKNFKTANSNKMQNLKNSTAQTIKLSRLKTSVDDILQKVLIVYSQILTPEMLVSLGIQVGVEKFIDLAKIQLKKVSMETITLLIKSNVLSAIKNELSARLLVSVISSNLVRVAVEQLATTVGKLAIIAAQMSVSALTIVGWLLIIGPLLDLVFIFWDPLKLNKQLYSNETLAQLSEAALKARQVQQGQRTVEMEPDTLWTYFIVRDSKKFFNETTISQIRFSADYFANRIYNSDGSVFNWHADSMNVDTHIVSIKRSLQQYNINNMLFTMSDIEKYEAGSYNRAGQLSFVNRKFLFSLSCALAICVFVNAKVGLLLLIVVVITFGNILQFLVYNSNNKLNDDDSNNDDDHITDNQFLISAFEKI